LVPLAAFDLASAVAAFQDTPYFIAIDNHPFLFLNDEFPLPEKTTSYPTKLMPYEINAASPRRKSKAIIEYDQMYQRSGGWLPRIIGRMRQVFPNFRVRLVQYFVEPYLANSSLLKKLPVALPCHGILSFDLGEGTKPKTALFINSMLRANEARGLGSLQYLDQPELGQAHPIDLSFADGLFVKGCGAIFAWSSLQRFLLNIMRKNGGTILDGKKMGVFEFGELPTSTTRTYVAPSIPLSYEDGMRISTFSPLTANASPAQNISEVLNIGGMTTFDYTPAPHPAVSDAAQLTYGDLVRTDNRVPHKKNRILEELS